MKYTYRIHPEDFSLGENEQFYADMAKKGLRLVKRGMYLSKFEKTEPADRIYRIELATPGFMDDPDLPEEQVEFYEESGWTLAAQYGVLHIFEAPAGTQVMELYTDPREQLPAMKKYRNRHIWATLGTFGWLAFLMFMGRTMNGSDDYWGELLKNWSRATSHFLGLGLLMVYGVLTMFWGLGRVTAMARRARKGQPLDRKPHWYSKAFRLFSRALLIGALCCYLLTLAELVTAEKYDMPAVADGPYITLSELGYTGERTTVYSSSKTSKVERAHSLISEIWDTYEAVKLDDDRGLVWMYQEVHRLRSGRDAGWLVRGMKADATMARDPSAFHKVVVRGLDEAWAAGLECIARVGDTVWYITSLGSTAHEEGREYQIRILEYLGQRFGDYENWTQRRMILHNGKLWADTGKQMPGEPDPSIIQYTAGFVPEWDTPTSESQINFPQDKVPFAVTSSGLVLLIDNEWTLFEELEY